MPAFRVLQSLPTKISLSYRNNPNLILTDNTTLTLGSLRSTQKLGLAGLTTLVLPQLARLGLDKSGRYVSMTYQTPVQKLHENKKEQTP